MDYLLSIVVPVKNNYECLKSIINLSNEKSVSSIEFIIQDNTEKNKEIIEYINKEKKENLKYFHIKENISMSENFNRAILNASGEYILILGADDNISSKILDVVKYIDLNDIESAIFKKAKYNWPGMKFRIHQNLPNLIIPRSKDVIREINCEKEFIRLLKRGMVSIGKLPNPYHGIVKRDLLIQVFKITGTCVPGASPDMAMAVALTQIVKKHVIVELPYVLSGHSFNSAGGKGARREHKGDLKNKNFLPLNVEENWPRKIPKLWTNPTIYADSLFSSLKSMNKEEKLHKFNYLANYSNIISFFPEYKQILNDFIDKKPNIYFKIFFNLFLIFILRLRVFLINVWISNFTIFGKRTYKNINNSLEASKVLDNYIIYKKSRLKKYNM